MTTEFLKQVAEFHTTFKHPILDTPTIPSNPRMDLRYSLIKEENEELLKDGIEKEDIVAVADALADLQYVLAGTILEFGLGDKFLEIFNEVHRSNMSKACKTEEEALSTVEYYRNEKDTESHYEYDEKLNLYFVYRDSDNKSLKSINYSPADIKSILNGNT